MNTTSQQTESPQPISNLQILQLIQSGVPVANIAHSIDLEAVQDTYTRTILRTALASHIRIVEHITESLSTPFDPSQMESIKFDEQ